MKKFLNIISALAAITFHCSCISEEIAQDEQVSGIRVYSDWTDTRTSHNSENGVTSVSWVSGDKIGLFTEEQSNLCYIAESTGASSDFIASDVMLDADDRDNVYACYPYDPLIGQDGKSFRLPHTQGQWSSAGLSVYDALYAEGTVSNDELNLKFKHIFSFLEITVPTDKLVLDSESGYYALRIVSNEMLSNIEGNFNVETKELDANCTTDVLYIIDEDITDKSSVTCTVALLPQTGDANISIYACADNFSVENLLHTIDVPDSGLEAGKVYTLRIKVDYIDEYGINHGPGVSVNGVVWAPVNCGYHAEDFKYGKLYQWGRKYGQGFSGDIYDANGNFSGTYSDSTVPEFVQGPVGLSEGQSEDNADKFYVNVEDWCGEPHDNLWNAGTEENPVKAEYDPCPEGWRVPTYAELKGLSKNRSGWTSEDGQIGYWFSGTRSYTAEVPRIFFPAAGYLDSDGRAGNRGSHGCYWSSSPNNNSSIIYLLFYSSAAGMTYDVQVWGQSVRCVQE